MSVWLAAADGSKDEKPTFPAIAIGPLPCIPIDG
jgi:hypothetical protein